VRVAQFAIKKAPSWTAVRNSGTGLPLDMPEGIREVK
jgi:hypothetical protein